MESRRKYEKLISEEKSADYDNMNVMGEGLPLSK